MSSVRVRFAPSPTGYLHIGGARTALFNWLWAKKNKGTFILRVEDTDKERSTDESVRAILDSMQWLGLDWDEGPVKGGEHGPYYQLQRLPIYKEFAERLIAQKIAYRCFCSKEDLALAREKHAQSGSKNAFRYPGTCRSRTDQPDKPYVVRLKAPTSGTTGWNDLVKGRIDVPNDAQQDVVLMRADGVPLYNFGAAVDDITMGVTLVARGDDHVVNTPVQIMLFEALSAPMPEFAHLPMILAPNGEKLSKRHAAVSALDYRDKGFLPDAVLNYLARLGWSHGDQEIFSRGELIEYFDWTHVGSGGAKYDAKKFEYVQASHLRALSNEVLVKEAAPFFEAAGLPIDPNKPSTLAAFDTVKTRAVTLSDFVTLGAFYFREDFPIDDKARAKFLTAASVEKLEALHDELRHFPSFERSLLEAHVHDWLTKKGWALKDVAQPARVALTGQTQSPGLFEMMEVLGKDRTLLRVARALDLAKQAS